MADTKYGEHFVTIPFHQGSKGPLMSLNSEKLNGFNVQIIFAYAYETGITGKSTEPHVHDFDETIFFIGSDPNHFDELGATVEMSMGEKGKEEKHIFDVPTAVVVPAGLPHCPMVTKSIEKPYLCMAVSLTDKYTH